MTMDMDMMDIDSLIAAHSLSREEAADVIRLMKSQSVPHLC